MRSFDLPVSAALPGLRAALDSAGAAVLAASPGIHTPLDLPLPTGRGVYTPPASR